MKKKIQKFYIRTHEIINEYINTSIVYNMQCSELSEISHL